MIQLRLQKPHAAAGTRAEHGDSRRSWAHHFLTVDWGIIVVRVQAITHLPLERDPHNRHEANRGASLCTHKGEHRVWFGENPSSKRPVPHCASSYSSLCLSGKAPAIICHHDNLLSKSNGALMMAILALTVSATAPCFLVSFGGDVAHGRPAEKGTTRQSLNKEPPAAIIERF